MGSRFHAGAAADRTAGSPVAPLDDDDLLDLREEGPGRRTPREQIARLLHQQSLQQVQHERLLSRLPVPVLITDRYGAVRAVNAAAAVLAGRHPAQLEGRAVFAFFSAEDRTGLQELLAGVGAEPSGTRRAGRLLTRSGHAVAVTVSLTPLDVAEGTVSWLLVTSDHASGVDEAQPLSEGLRRLAAIEAEGRTAAELVQEAALACGDVLGPLVDVTIQLGPPERPDLVASTSQVAQAMDGAQLLAGEGPAATAFREGELVWVEDVHRDTRWPALADAAPAPVGGVVAVPMVGEDRVRGVLSAYRLEAGVDGRLLELAELLAITVRGLLQELDLEEELRRAADDLQRALTSRSDIDQAKGIVMAQQGCGPEEAFDHLVALASSEHVKLREVARLMVRRFAGGTA
ncbi:GAF and ANTAR domain-containing protein [Nocardioides pantholopis]|uniref:GAF and ANTAR domain-containing protein n=1 Tax=Nocardioides pantholopis TaxID=2483798 RepID=UPI000F081625|nr:GAF and ANTAR domain-containing protein [Nocardioides pantholopis]